jgi:hypothetical protein
VKPIILKGLPEGVLEVKILNGFFDLAGYPFVGKSRQVVQALEQVCA